MVTAERRIAHTAPGPYFERIDGEVMFSFVIDPSNVIGPRLAKRSDQEKHAGEWVAFCEAEGVSLLDRDADGEVGGSLPQEAVAPVEPETPPTDDVEAEAARIRADLKTLGVKVHHKAGLATLRKALEDATAPKAD